MARPRPGPGSRPGSATAGRVRGVRGDLPVYLEALEAAGKRREDQTLYVGFQGEWLSDETLDDSPWVLEPRRRGSGGAAGADGAIVLARTTADVDLLVDAVARW